MKLYTTRTAACILGVKQDTVKHYSVKFGIGRQPGGFHTPWMYTLEDLQRIREVRKHPQYERFQALEDRDELELGPMFRSVDESDYLRQRRRGEVDGDTPIE